MHDFFFQRRSMDCCIFAIMAHLFRFTTCLPIDKPISSEEVDAGSNADGGDFSAS